MLATFRNAKNIAYSCLIFFAVACSSGSGCSSCAGCGVAPIPGGYPIADRIDNSAQVRLTHSGRAFIEDNATSLITTFLPGGLVFPIPASTPPDSGSSGYQLCPDNDCAAAGEILDVRLTPAGPTRMHAEADVVITSRQNVAGYPRRGLTITGQTGCAFGVCAIHVTCDADIDTNPGDRRYVTIQADIDFVADTHPARNGYTRIVVTNAGLAPGAGIEDDQDVRVTDCGGFLGGLVSSLANLLRTTLLDSITGQIPALIQGQLDSALCTKRGEYGCPTGTFARPNENTDSTCRYANSDDAECVPTLLGTDGQGDLGAAFLGGFSPGTHGSGQFLLASGGAGEVVNDGVSLFFYGGYRSTNRNFTESPSHNSCVPAIEPPALPEIPRITTFRGNVIPGTTTETHVAIGLSEDYLNHAAYGMFDSGMLCLGAGTRSSQMLTTGLFSALITSLRNLSFPVDSAAISLAIRPQLPPHITVRTDMSMPLLNIAIPQLSIDFYVFSNDRYIRFMTYTADLSIDANLTVSGASLTPTLSNVTASNSVVTNSELLSENPASLATTLQTLLGSLAGTLTSSLPSFDLPAIMGINLTIPEGGVRGVTEDGDNFIGVFANLSLAASGSATTAMADTHLETTELHVNPEAMSIEHFAEGDAPGVRLFMDAQGPHGVDYEYSYRLDGESWSAWTRDRNVDLVSTNFFWQARHVVEARARIAGSAASVDTTPARVELLVDILAPEVTATVLRNQVRVEAHDIITPTTAMRYRFRANNGAWTPWATSSTFTPDASGPVDVEAMDESGNVAGARAELIRGIADPNATGGCSCDVPGTTGSGSSTAGFAALLLFALVFVVRRVLRGTSQNGLQRALIVVALPVVLSVSGCSCNDGAAGLCQPACAEAEGGATVGSRCCAATVMCVQYDLNALCEPAHHCSSAEHVIFDGCTPTCDDCVLNPPLPQGQLAPFLDMTQTPDGDTVFSGYAAGVPPTRKYGDLVFGTYDVSSESVEWEIVDGVPDADPSGDPSGWRDGISVPGNDVGRYSSIAASANGVYISYYDATNGDLKLAIRGEAQWDIQTVDPDGDCGRFSSIAFLPGGEPAIAYNCIGPKTDAPGVIEGTMLVAVANSATPSAREDWNIRILQRNDMACRPQYCATGEQCFASGACAAPTADCSAACASGTACHNGTCESTIAAPYVEDYPNSTGLFASLQASSTGLGVVFYNRGTGNLYGAAFDGSSWGTPFLVDGYLNAPSGDCGIGASLFIDDSDGWHVSYVDGSEEQLKYRFMEPGASDGFSTAAVLVDDGSSDGASPFTDGRHVMGDDSSIAVTASGEVRIVYQDATSGRAMMATRTPRGSPTTPWSRTVIDSTDHTGYFLEQNIVGGASYVATWWRREGTTGMGANGVRVINIP